MVIRSCLLAFPKIQDSMNSPIKVHSQWYPHMDAVVEMIIEWGRVQEKHVHVITLEEIERCPKVFRCFVCGERKPDSEFGGEVAKERVCKSCIRYVDDWDVGVIIKSDRYRKEKKPRAKK
jgi:hypothetical protein